MQPLCNVCCSADKSKAVLCKHIPFRMALLKECLDAWSVLNQCAVSSCEDVVQQVIWNNKDTVEQRSIFKKGLFSKGIITISDLLYDAGIFLKGVKVLNANLSPIEYFSLMSIVDAIPLEW